MNTTAAARPSFSLPEFDTARLGQRKPEFMSWVAICLLSGAKSYVELGTGHAGYMRAAGIPSVVAVDINNPPFYGVPHEGVSYVQGSSYDEDTRTEVLNILGRFPDIVFIDADHDGDAPRRDFDLWYPVAQKLVGFHDILIPNIVPIWNEIAFRHPSVEIIGRDLASAQAWQGMGTSPDGRISGGGIGVIWKT